MPKIAIAGVKSGVGREFLNLLSENGVPVGDVLALEARAPLGTLASYGEDDEVDVLALENFDFAKADIAVFATTKELGKRYLKKAVAAGCRVLDLSGATFPAGGRRAVVGGVSDFAAAGRRDENP